MTIKTLQFAIFGTLLSLVGLLIWRLTQTGAQPEVIDIVTLVLLAAQLLALEAPRRRGLVRFPDLRAPGGREEARQFALFATLGAIVLALMILKPLLPRLLG